MAIKTAISLHKDTGGFTLIEMLIAVAAVSVIGLGAAGTTYHVINVNALSNTRMLAVKQVENAISWISQDAQMAQTIQVDGGASGFPLTLTWVEWNNTTHQVIYSIQGDQLKRSQSLNAQAATTTIAASHIDVGTDATNCQFDGGAISGKITSTVGGFRTSTESRTYSIVPRPSQ